MKEEKKYMHKKVHQVIIDFRLNEHKSYQNKEEKS
jgi:hypothetical protein